MHCYPLRNLGTFMTQWEYRKIRLNDLARKSDDIDLLCDAGEEGWELVVMLPNNVAYLKRECREEPDVGTRSAEDDADESRSEVKAKYRDAVTGDTWSGRGRMATWLKRKQDAGEDIEKYRV
jgi:H-NS histone C-terminal domain